MEKSPNGGWPKSSPIVNPKSLDVSSDDSAFESCTDEESQEEMEEAISKDKDSNIREVSSSWEKSLPIKTGLSKFYHGRSRSFYKNLNSEARTMDMKDLEKKEHPFNKRRRLLNQNNERIRLLNASKMNMKGSSNPTAAPIQVHLALSELKEEERNQQEAQEETDQERCYSMPQKFSPPNPKSS